MGEVFLTVMDLNPGWLSGRGDSGQERAGLREDHPAVS